MTKNQINKKLEDLKTRTKTFQLKLTPDFREELEAAAERDGFKQGQLGTWMKWVLAQYAQKTLTLRPIKQSQRRIK